MPAHFSNSRDLVPLSHSGWYTVPKLVGRRAKGRSRFEGRVLKLTVPLPAEEARLLKPHLQAYARHLALAGIDTGNPCFFILHDRRHRCRLGYVHDHFQPTELLSHHLPTCSSGEVLHLFHEVRRMSDLVLQYSRQSGIRLGLDLRLKNLALRDGQLVYLDLLPAFIDGRCTPHDSCWLRLLRRARWRLGARCAPAIGSFVLRLLVAKRMLPRHRMHLAARGFFAAHPALAGEFKRLLREAPVAP